MAEEEEKTEEEIIDSRNILYVGYDHSFFKSLKENFIEIYPDETFEFTHLLKDNNEKKSPLLHKISLNLPHIIFLDYSQHTKNILNLAQNLKREYSTKNSTVIGLLENLDSKQTLLSSLSLGITINLIKGMEKSNPIHHAMTIAFPEIAKDTEVALAKEVVDLNATTLFKLSYVTERYIHIESCFHFDKGTPAKIVSKLDLPMDLSHNYLVRDKQDYNIYSNHNCSYDLTIDHMDSTEIDFLANKIEEIEERIKSKNKEDDPASLKYELDERNAELGNAIATAEEDAKKRPGVLKKWMRDNYADSKIKAKRTKMLMVDRNMACLYEASHAFDNFPFSTQLYSSIDKNEDIIHRVQPGIIAFNFDSDDIEENRNDIDTLKYLISLVEKQEHLYPIILVFSYNYSLEKLQKDLDYNRLVVSKDPMGLDFIKECCSVYRAKAGRDKTHDPVMSKAKNEERVYLGKHDPRSILYYHIPIKVNSISETDLIFDSEVDIPMYTGLYIKSPVKMTITVVPFKADSSRKPADGKYYALINGIGELDRASLRKYVNELIFKSKEPKN